MPERIAEILPILRILLEYGRHLAATLERRAAARTFSVIAQCFGTAKLPVILAHLHRGIMRAIVLERLLRARAARGRDLVICEPGTRAPREVPPPPEPDAAASVDAQPPPPEPEPAPRPARHAEPEYKLDLHHMPTMQQVEAEVRRRPVGRVLADICRDFGARPGVCTGNFWTSIMMALLRYRGNLPAFTEDMRQRQTQFEKERDKNPGLDWPELSRDAVRRVLGFFVGEPPVMPVPTMAGVPIIAAATGPP